MKKTQNAKRKTRNKRFLILNFSFTLFALNFTFNCYAKDITILYSGETHAMLYPCSCPIEADGGVARRATLIKQLKKSYPEALVLDSGGFFAGGLLDEYTQNTQMDMQRTLVNLKSMELMGTDAATIGDDEFNFGRGFLQENINKTKFKFLSCNLKMDQVLPYIIKEVAGIKIGIIGVTSRSAKEKAGGLEITDPEKAVSAAVGELKKSGVKIIVLLSHLGESEDLNLLKKVRGIDILIIGHARAKEGPFDKIGNTLILRPTWQGRRLGKVTFSLKDNLVTNPRVEELRLSDKIPDDAKILSILPRCFSNNNCKKQGMLGTCQNPGNLGSRCVFSEAKKVNLIVITRRSCLTCDTASIINFLKRNFPGLIVSYQYYPDKKTENLLKELKIPGLPAYLLGKEIEKANNFEAFKQNLEPKGNYYILKPQVSGYSIFLNRNKIKGRFDLFLSLFDKNATGILDVVKEFNPKMHFLVSQQQGRLDAAGGNYEIEESLRGVCVQKYYPEYFWNYISCRAANIASSWWEDCLGKYSAEKIKICARSQEGLSLLRENISLNKELQIMFGPTYLVDNQEIFSSKGAPSKEELKKIMKR